MRSCRTVLFFPPFIFPTPPAPSPQGEGNESQNNSAEVFSPLREKTSYSVFALVVFPVFPASAPSGRLQAGSSRGVPTDWKNLGLAQPPNESQSEPVVRSSIPRRIEKQDVDFVELSFSKISFRAKTFLPSSCFSQFISPRRASKISSADELVCSCRAPVVAGRQTSHLLKNFFEIGHGRGLIGLLGLFLLTPLPRFARFLSPWFVVIGARRAEIKHF